ncbi:6-pyruvoyl trahydropterin synthase family protein [Rhizobium oryzicola]|uniref:6-carboxy-5,6,7,8-tetrahydropterin synthase n=1 Tax=Rhizobium oryzicola TaxID=1232668 RepID=A0ABT8SWG1_9HYPH|nr:6-carboxytetrahydropterin synthase [Rhizobium oryzicola]MDO1582782.1 6-carboxytetrahydropterin synthase [Rhizobium oryzicola]
MRQMTMADLTAPLRGSPSAIYRSTKTYDHSEGLSCCFRQWRAEHSHCKLLHGYALAFKFVFATYELDQHNWCYDFGGLKEVRKWLHAQFDHTLVVSEDDPELATFVELEKKGLVDLRILPAVGCEQTARFCYEYVAALIERETKGRVWLESVEVSEHGGNSAIFSVSR